MESHWRNYSFSGRVQHRQKCNTKDRLDFSFVNYFKKRKFYNNSVSITKNRKYKFSNRNQDVMTQNAGHIVEFFPLNNKLSGQNNRYCSFVTESNECKSGNRHQNDEKLLDFIQNNEGKMLLNFVGTKKEWQKSNSKIHAKFCFPNTDMVENENIKQKFIMPLKKKKFQQRGKNNFPHNVFINKDYSCVESLPFKSYKDSYGQSPLWKKTKYGLIKGYNSVKDSKFGDSARMTSYGLYGKSNKIHHGKSSYVKLNNFQKRNTIQKDKKFLGKKLYPYENIKKKIHLDKINSSVKNSTSSPLSNYDNQDDLKSNFKLSERGVSEEFNSDNLETANNFSNMEQHKALNSEQKIHQEESSKCVEIIEEVEFYVIDEDLEEGDAFLSSGEDGNCGTDIVQLAQNGTEQHVFHSEINIQPLTSAKFSSVKDENDCKIVNLTEDDKNIKKQCLSSIEEPNSNNGGKLENITCCLPNEIKAEGDYGQCSNENNFLQISNQASLGTKPLKHRSCEQNKDANPENNSCYIKLVNNNQEIKIVDKTLNKLPGAVATEDINLENMSSSKVEKLIENKQDISYQMKGSQDHRVRASVNEIQQFGGHETTYFSTRSEDETKSFITHRILDQSNNVKLDPKETERNENPSSPSQILFHHIKQNNKSLFLNKQNKKQKTNILGSVPPLYIDNICFPDNGRFYHTESNFPMPGIASFESDASSNSKGSNESHLNNKYNENEFKIGNHENFFPIEISENNSSSTPFLLGSLNSAQSKSLIKDQDFDSKVDEFIRFPKHNQHFINDEVNSIALNHVTNSVCNDGNLQDMNSDFCNESRSYDLNGIFNVNSTVRESCNIKFVSCENLLNSEKNVPPKRRGDFDEHDRTVAVAKSDHKHRMQSKYFSVYSKKCKDPCASVNLVQVQKHQECDLNPSLMSDEVYKLLKPLFCKPESLDKKSSKKSSPHNFPLIQDDASSHKSHPRQQSANFSSSLDALDRNNACEHKFEKNLLSDEHLSSECLPFHTCRTAKKNFYPFDNVAKHVGHKTVEGGEECKEITYQQWPSHLVKIFIPVKTKFRHDPFKEIYDREWVKFYEKRKNELLIAGKTPDDYDFEGEWIECWENILKNEAVKSNNQGVLFDPRLQYFGIQNKKLENTAYSVADSIYCNKYF